MAGSGGGGLHLCGPQLIWGEHLVRHVPQIEAEAEASPGTVIVKSDSREVLSCEYATMAKSLVISTPDTRTG
jgi:hypothetical protein